MSNFNMIFCGAMGYTYAGQHFQSTRQNYTQKAYVSALGHGLVGCIEYFPLAGSIAALIEFIARNIFNQFSNNFTEQQRHLPDSTPTPLLPAETISASSEDSPSSAVFSSFLSTDSSSSLELDKTNPLTIKDHERRMRANLTKAVEEHNHVSLNPNNSGSSNDASSSSATSTVSPYISQIQSSASVGASFLGKLLNFEHAVSAAQGKRPEMEDAHFIMEIDHFILAGVLDGHGGADVANIASDLIQKGFFYKLREKEGDVYATFDSLFKEIQHQIIKNENLSRQGATAVVTLIDKQTNCIYTATLGDSEANIYTPDEADLSSFKSIPLSCLRDWGSKRDAARYASAATYNEEEEQHRMGAALGEIGAEGKSKYIRFPLYPRTWPWKHEDVDEDIYGIKQCILSCNVHGRLNISRTFGDSVYYQYRSEIYNRKTQTRESAPSEPKEVTSCKPKVTMIELKNIIGNDSEMILVLTSDGLKDYAGGRDLLSVRDRESAIIETIKTHKTSPPQIIADELVNLGLSGVPAESVGDNMTVIAIKIIIASSKV